MCGQWRRKGGRRERTAPGTISGRVTRGHPTGWQRPPPPQGIPSPPTSALALTTTASESLLLSREEWDGVWVARVGGERERESDLPSSPSLAHPTPDSSDGAGQRAGRVRQRERAEPRRCLRHRQQTTRTSGGCSREQMIPPLNGWHAHVPYVVVPCIHHTVGLPRPRYRSCFVHPCQSLP